MREQGKRKLSVRWVAIFGVLLSLSIAGEVSAQMSSPSYQVNEAQFGSGSSLNDCSGNYCAKTSTGDLVNGSGSSGNYSAQFGFNTSDAPMLEVSVTAIGAQNLGVLSTATTASTSYGVTVRNYLSQGYIMQITGSPPKNGPHILNPLTSETTVNPGAEQFGINLADNTTPNVGAGPIQIPDDTFSYGNVASDYSTPDLFKYIDGDVVASSLSQSGQTNYTISMILNISAVTPGGQYKGAMSAVVTPVY